MTDPDIIFAPYDAAGDLGIPAPHVALVEIGSPGHFTDADASNAVESICRLAGTPTMLVIGGYDDDPRGLWDIPEAREYIQRFVIRAWARRTALRWNLDDQTKALLARCWGAVVIHRNGTMDVEPVIAAFLGIGTPQAEVFNRMDAAARAKRKP
jgi:hypothetical protein